MSKLQKRLSRKEKRRNESNTNYIVNNRFNMRRIDPLTASQEEFFDDYARGYNIAAIGTAGTGKTMCAMYLGLRDILSKPDYEKIIIVRSAVQTREQGFIAWFKTTKRSSIHYSIRRHLCRSFPTWRRLGYSKTKEYGRVYHIIIRPRTHIR